MEVIAILLIAAVVILYVAYTNRKGGQKLKETYWVPPPDFIIYNYLKVPVKVAVDLRKNSHPSAPRVIAERIEPSGKVGITKDIADKYLAYGGIIRVYLLSNGLTLDQKLKSNGVKTPSPGLTHYSDLKIDTPDDKRIKNLHIGMITSRFIAKTTDTLRMSTVNGNAIQGNAWLKIHNLTTKTLKLNDDLVIKPHSEERYLGYLHQGVTLGTIFKDQDGLYPDFQYLHPDTDVYYGVVSDVKQPIHGPLQLEYSDDVDQTQTLWPFELGQM